MVRVEVAVVPFAKATIAGLILAVGPVGPVVAARLTVPANPAPLAIRMTELPDCPASRDMDAGLTDSPKNGEILGGVGELFACIQSKLLFVSHDASACMLTRLVLPGVVSGSVYEPTKDPSKYP
jgi:hypothetical protein